MQPGFTLYQGKLRKIAKKSIRYNETLTLVDFKLLVNLLFECLEMLIWMLFNDLGSINMIL